MKQALFFLLVIFLNACQHNGTSTGDPIVNLKVNGSSKPMTVSQLNIWQRMLRFVLPSAVAAPASVEDSGSLPIILTQFWTTIGEIEFELTETPGADETDGEGVEFEGPYVTDMLQTNVEAVGTATIQQHQIRRIKGTLKKTSTLPTGAPGALLNKSIFISGTVNGFPFTYVSEEETKIEVGGPNAVAAATGSDLLLQLQIANLFRKIDLSSIGGSTDISESNRVPVSNPCPNIDVDAADLYSCFRKGIENETNFGEDGNGDNELDGDDETVK
jgi:hypothetical protein